ncbi:MAG: hypothetical protein B5766_11000 [Candidatus Lumbricidophila eiseniae]|uniref:SURF1-like protein n=1 Tax=Candidatus Lumbricidiphila eiseniae TaxID=1969409 RepID=A0A2A6FNI7_9MICO|nr:MAG: hypothetical protein B5766_11000 [Candidatus Lumbricidophila eiseniae]
MTSPLVRMMVRPRWLAALALALALAAGFALLGQWQLARAVIQPAAIPGATEQVRDFAGLVAPDGPTLQSATAQLVRVTGHIIAGDTVLVSNRRNDTEFGWWVVAHLEVTAAAPGGLPVALGWAATEAQARAAAAQVDVMAGPSVTIVGRFLPSEAPVAPKDGADPFEMRAVSVADLVNRWVGYDNRPVYFGYVTALVPPSSLIGIVSPPPERGPELNWLSVFYALEWAVFAGFAIFLWFRLVRDALEREREPARVGVGGYPP